MHLANEILEHLLGHFEVGNDAVLHRPDRGDVARRTAKHAFRIGTHGGDALLRAVVTDRHHRRLVEDDAATTDVNQGVRGTQIDGKVC